MTNLEGEAVDGREDGYNWGCVVRDSSETRWKEGAGREPRVSIIIDSSRLTRNDSHCVDMLKGWCRECQAAT